MDVQRTRARQEQAASAAKCSVQAIGRCPPSLTRKGGRKAVCVTLLLYAPIVKREFRRADSVNTPPEARGDITCADIWRLQAE